VTPPTGNLRLIGTKRKVERAAGTLARRLPQPLKGVLTIQTATRINLARVAD
jgi:hypothetical protein